MAELCKVATCNLNQWALDFEGNYKRIVSSIKQAKQQGCTFRTGPELEVTGYTCEDHFFEYDTFVLAWDSIAKMLDSDLTDGIICDVGLPIMHRNVSYNCRIFLLNRKVIGVRPKMCLANDGNYRETRWFTAWSVETSKPGFGEVEDFYLPINIMKITGQQKVPIGIIAIRTRDTVIASETCEELFTPNSPHIMMSLDGVEIIANGSGSHHQLRKLNTRIDLVRGATAKGGGIYLYANQKGVQEELPLELLLGWTVHYNQPYSDEWCCSSDVAVTGDGHYCRASTKDFIDVSETQHFESSECDFAAGERRVTSFLTMGSPSGLLFGIANIVGNFGTVFVDQSYWQSAVAANPKSAVKGFLIGGLVGFAAPFCMATTTGLAGRALTMHPELWTALDNPDSSSFAFSAHALIMVCIVLSTIAAVMETVQELHKAYNEWFTTSEVVFTLAFTVEILLRAFSASCLRSYLTNCANVVDIVATS
ncbi:unnamed protein product, partial [Polarella glacialis]